VFAITNNKIRAQIAKETNRRRCDDNGNKGGLTMAEKRVLPDTKDTKKNLQILSSKPAFSLHETSKTCTKCGVPYTGKLSDYFSPRRNAADGLRNQCRECVNKAMRKRRAKSDVKVDSDYLRDILKEAAKEIIREKLSSH
jgi:hypothetical protein